MSIPSDVTPDISDAMGDRRQSTKPRNERWSTEQRGLALAAFVAFLGVAYLGPAAGRIFRKPRLEDRIAIRLRDARQRARRAGGKAKKRVRRLGGGAIRP